MKEFIAAKKNKDNFWNLFFWIGMTIGSLTIGTIASALIIPFIFKRSSKITVNKGEQKLFDSNGNEIMRFKESGIIMDRK